MSNATTANLSFRDAVRIGDWLPWSCHHSVNNDIFTLARDYINSVTVFQFAGIVHVWDRGNARIVVALVHDLESPRENQYVLLWWDVGSEEIIEGCSIHGATCNAQAIAQAGFCVRTESKQALQAMGLTEDRYAVWYRWHSQEELQFER